MSIKKQLLFWGINVILMLQTCDNINSDAIPESKEVSSEYTETAVNDTEQNSVAETVETTTEKIRDNVTMYYDLDEVMVDGCRIESQNYTDYDLDRLIPVQIYEQSGAKLYAYEYNCETDDGFQYTDFKLLLEHDGKYQVFENNDTIYFSYMFEWDAQGDLYGRDFEQGDEFDFDNDGRLELVKFITTGFGTGFLSTEIVIFDYNEDIGEYDAYHTSSDYFDDLVDEAAEAFFDEYYKTYYRDENGKYKFENGFSVICSYYVYAQMNDDNKIEVSHDIYGDPRNDGGLGYEIGSMKFEVDYIGEGRFTVKASRYVEWHNIMDPDLIL